MAAAAVGGRDAGGAAGRRRRRAEIAEIVGERRADLGIEEDKKLRLLDADDRRVGDTAAPEVRT